MEYRPVVVLGAGGHALVVMANLKVAGYKNLVLLDDNPLLGGIMLDGRKYDVAGSIESEVLRKLTSEGATKFIIGIGSVDAAGCALREKLYLMALGAGLQPVNAVSVISTVTGNLGLGVFVGIGAIVMPGAVIGANSIINTGAVVEHDCRVGWSSHIATRAVLCGGVVLGKGVHVGAGAVVKQGVSIGDGATIGMGAVVLEDVGPGLTVVGNPAQDIERFKSAMARLDRKS